MKKITKYILKNKEKIQLFLICISLVILLTLLISIISSSYYILEIISSFLPYTFSVVSIITILLLLYIFIKKVKLNKISIVVILFSLLYILIAGYRLADFACIPINQSEDKGKELTFAFYNMHFQNTSYDDIDKEINRINPDILGLAELTPDRVGILKSLSNYPYVISALNYEAKDVAIFSKYELTQNVSLDSDTNFYISANTIINNKSYTIVVAHPLPPFDQRLLNLGNIVLKKIEDRFNKSNTIILGDFNLTPWSQRYSSFTNGLSSLKDTSKGKGLNFTWGEFPLTLQVDHIFVPKDAYVKEFVVGGKMNSDHNLIYTKIVVN